MPPKVVWHDTVQIRMWIIFDMKYERENEYLPVYILIFVYPLNRIKYSP